MPVQSLHKSAAEYAQSVLRDGAVRCLDGTVIYPGNDRNRGGGVNRRGKGSLIPCYIPRDLDDLSAARNREQDDPVQAQLTRRTLMATQDMKGRLDHLTDFEQDRLKAAQRDKRHEGVNERRLLRGKPTMEQEEAGRAARRSERMARASK